jgi:hypothetical protein
MVLNYSVGNVRSTSVYDAYERISVSLYHFKGTARTPFVVFGRGHCL